MNKRTETVFHGFLALDDQEQADLIDQIKKHFNQPEDMRESIHKAVRRGEIKMNLGPLPTTCVCCGR
jgi:hypothetical protein